MDEKFINDLDRLIVCDSRLRLNLSIVVLLLTIVILSLINRKLSWFAFDALIKRLDLHFHFVFILHV